MKNFDIDGYWSPKELAEFVLKECGDMNDYAINESGTIITIKGRFDAERFCYYTQLLKKKYKSNVIYLSLLDITNIEDDEWLEKSNLESINFSYDMTVLPRLPLDTIEIIYWKGDMYSIEGEQSQASGKIYRFLLSRSGNVIDYFNTMEELYKGLKYVCENPDSSYYERDLEY